MKILFDNPATTTPSVAQFPAMTDAQKPDFGRTWLYRALARGDAVAEERHGSDVVACQWAAQVVAPRLRGRSISEDLTVERQNADGTWHFVDNIPSDAGA